MPVLHAERANLYVLEGARVHRRGGSVEYACEADPRSFNVPSANASFLLLGPGSSVTAAAARLLAADGVLVGFCGAGGTPLVSAQASPAMFEPADGSRDPTHLHAWVGTWSDEGRRLRAAKSFMAARKASLEAAWDRLGGPGPWPDLPLAKMSGFAKAVAASRDHAGLAAAEAALTEALHAEAAKAAGMTMFVRVRAKPRGRRRRPTGPASDVGPLLDQGGFLVLGLASVVLWVLGIPAALSVGPGRGNLASDLAAVVEDAVVLPLAFNVAARAVAEGLTHADFRSALIDAFERERVMHRMFEAMEGAVAR